MDANNLALAAVIHGKLKKAEELLEYIENKDKRIPESAWPAKLVFTRTVKHTTTVVHEGFEVPLATVYTALRGEVAGFRRALIDLGVTLNA